MEEDKLEIIKKLPTKQPLKRLNCWLGEDDVGQHVAKATGRVLTHAITHWQGCFDTGIWASMGVEINQLNLQGIYPSLQLLPYCQPNVTNAVCCSLYELPLPSDSLDGILVLFALDCLPHPLSVLHEVARVLKGQGCAYLCLVNRWSLWCFPGFNRWNRKINRHFPSPMGLSALKKGLKHTPLKITEMTPYHYAPLYRLSLTSSTFFDHLGRLIMPYPANFLMVKVVKYVHSMTAVHPTPLADRQMIVNTFDTPSTL